MRHGSTEQEWVDYLDGFNPLDQRQEMENHLSGCIDCQCFVNRLQAVEAGLKSAALRLREELTATTPGEIAAARQRTLVIANDRCVSTRVGALYLLLVPMCGEEMSGRLIRKAARRTIAGPASCLTGQLWLGFLDQLHSIVAPLCGEPAARLVRMRGAAAEGGLA